MVGNRCIMTFLWLDYNPLKEEGWVFSLYSAFSPKNNDKLVILSKIYKKSFQILLCLLSSNTDTNVLGCEEDTRTAVISCSAFLHESFFLDVVLEVTSQEAKLTNADA